MVSLIHPSQIFDDPANFLHSIDIDADRAIFLRTNAQLLRDASFVDGRIDIATAAAAQAPLSAIIAAAPAVHATDRFLFNCSFCGSTLLARLLDVPGRSLVLKEPRCLTDIAAYKILNMRDGRPIDRLRPSLKVALAALRRRFTPAEAVTVKVASQGNILLDTLAEDAPRLRPIFITISRASFLRAIFRGGVDRMHYAARIAWHMATDEPEGDALLKEAMRAGGDPQRKAANLAILARYFQVGKFQRAAQIGGWNDNHVIDFDHIINAPRDAAIKAVAALELEITETDIDRNVASLSGRYSKQPDVAFSPEARQSVDRAVLAEHRQLFDEALAWADATLGTQRVVSG
ncbi:MAG: hypothetical protein ABI617_05470 [Sphingomicrobium sp.]